MTRPFEQRTYNGPDAIDEEMGVVDKNYDIKYYAQQLKARFAVEDEARLVIPTANEEDPPQVGMEDNFPFLQIDNLGEQVVREAPNNVVPHNFEFIDRLPSPRDSFPPGSIGVEGDLHVDEWWCLVMTPSSFVGLVDFIDPAEISSGASSSSSFEEFIESSSTSSSSNDEEFVGVEVVTPREYDL
ncbi:hypothetical protein TIFTF001_044440 [Ficus carica]|uniref:Uncharacterized protein n=1 Tax=Ficus carica TaxID=3494 RepID=A0AA87Z951_FICCA|nr:hypothetical protein TIFTF001_044440 [Ficus carica]